MPPLPPPFDRKPWLDCPLPAAAAAVPTMLSPEEGQFLHWLARDYADGSGAICDLGCFAGGSTARLAAGAAAGHGGPVLAYDHFTIQDHQKAQYLYSAGIPQFAGADMLPAVRQLLAPWRDIVTLHAGDIMRGGWRGGPIEVLFIDAAKTPGTADHIARAFFPHLMPGRSVIVQQDYLHWRQPWVSAQMELLADAALPVAWCRKGTVAFLVTGAITPDRLAAARTGDLDDPALIALLHRALRRFPARPQGARLARAILAIADNPGVRLPFRFDGSAIDQARVRAVLAEARQMDAPQLPARK